ncbi:MAG: ABC transporter permease [Acidimicrobiia bacterium]|nr:ABC transporter permease [Acidimicrobiia bacterium]
MNEFLDYTILGITAGAVYAVAASGLVLTYTTSGIFNFAHGAVGMLAAFTYWQLRFDWGWPTPIALVVVLVVLAPLVGALVERVVMRNLQGTSEVTKLVVSVALLTFMIGLAQVVWDTSVGRSFEGFFGIQGFDLGTVVVTWHKAITVGVAIAVAIGLRAFLYNTRTGISMRAVVGNRPLAELNGARPNRASMLSWAIGFSLAALAGILVAPILNLNVFALTLVVVSAYAAAVVGRLASLPLTFAGAIILGLAENYAVGYLTGGALDFLGGVETWVVGLRLSIPVVMLFVVLMAMPQARARGQSMLRSRERIPRPELGRSVRGAAVFVAAIAVVAMFLDGTLGWSGNVTWLGFLGRGLALAVVAVSLVPLVGYAGQISLAQMTFAGIGGITAAHWQIGGELAPLLGIAAAIVVAGAVGALVALPALRLRGIYLALATMAFAVFMDRTVFTQQSVFGGGSLDLERFGLFGFDVDGELAYTIFLAVILALVGIGIVFVRRGPLGRRLQAMKDSEAACATLGINLTRTKVEVFALSAGIAGLGGALFAGQKGTIVAADFDMFQSLPLLLMAVAGGIALVSGAIAGALLLAAFPFWIDVAPDWQVLGTSADEIARYGTLLAPGILGVTLGRNPNGAVSAVREGVAHLRTRLRRRSEPLSGPVVFAGPGEELETLGVDRPFTPDDLEVIDDALALDELVDGDGHAVHGSGTREEVGGARR